MSFKSSGFPSVGPSVYNTFGFGLALAFGFAFAFGLAFALGAAFIARGFPPEASPLACGTQSSRSIRPGNESITPSTIFTSLAFQAPI